MQAVGADGNADVEGDAQDGNENEGNKEDDKEDDGEDDEDQDDDEDDEDEDEDEDEAPTSGGRRKKVRSSFELRWLGLYLDPLVAAEKIEEVPFPGR